jgi:CBS-domain-containing membrane protein
MSLRQFADEFLLMQDQENQPLYFASSNGRDRGMVIPSELRNSDRQEWLTKTINDITKPIKSLDAVELNDKITEVIKLLETKKLRELTVLSRVGSVAGVIDRGDIIRALSLKLNWRIPESYIKQIKSEGKFPMNLNLMDIISQISS